MLLLFAMMKLVLRIVLFWLIAYVAPAMADDSMPDSTLSLSAHLESDRAMIRAGLVWRIYADPTDGTPARFVQLSEAAAPSFSLKPGAYIVHVAYGLSGTTQRIVLGANPVRETISLSAGAMVLNALVGDTPIPMEKVRYSIYVAVGTDPEGRLIADNVKSGVTVRLPVGTYRVVSRYGDTNAVASADLAVEPARLIKATLRHHAAPVTLKLVNNLGGEAYAGTNFSVLTPGGDTIRDLFGAFPSLILAEGDYILIARNAGRAYTSEFKVRSGVDQDIEILAR